VELERVEQERQHLGGTKKMGTVLNCVTNEVRVYLFFNLYILLCCCCQSFPNQLLQTRLNLLQSLGRCKWIQVTPLAVFLNTRSTYIAQQLVKQLVETLITVNTFNTNEVRK
jgi:hypothetical protein